jgi:hypothetical protein
VAEGGEEERGLDRVPAHAQRGQSPALALRCRDWLPEDDQGHRQEAGRYGEPDGQQGRHRNSSRPGGDPAQDDHGSELEGGHSDQRRAQQLGPPAPSLEGLGGRPHRGRPGV